MTEELKPCPFTVHDYAIESVIGELQERTQESTSLVNDIRQRMERNAEIIAFECLQEVEGER